MSMGDEMPFAPLTFQKASASVHLCSSQTAHLSYLNPMGGKGKGIHRRLGKQKRSLTGTTSADWGSVERESTLRVGCGMIIKACHGVLVCHVQLYSTLDVRRRKPYSGRRWWQRKKALSGESMMVLSTEGRCFMWRTLSLSKKCLSKNWLAFYGQGLGLATA